MNYAVIMAAGKGTRMKSETPKVLHEVLGIPMVEMIVSTCKDAGADKVISIVGYGKDEVKKALGDQCEFAIQEPQLGTGHAVMCCSQLEGLKGKTLVVNGDCPCIQSETLQKLYEEVEDCDMCVLTVKLDDAKSYGRVVRNKDGYVERIVEFKDCNEEEKRIKEINTGIYCFNNEKLFEGLKKVTNDNAQKEYYITDLVEIFNKEHLKVKAVVTENKEEVQGVNDPYELSKANAYLRDKINKKHMLNGVTMVDPNTVYLGKDVTFGSDVVIHPNVSIYGKSHIGNNVTIYPNQYMENVTVKDNENIK